MRDHCYWPLVSDLSNLLSHRPVALQFLSDDSLLEMWFSFLSMFQGNYIFISLRFIRRFMYATGWVCWFDIGPPISRQYVLAKPSCAKYLIKLPESFDVVYINFFSFILCVQAH